MIVIAIAIVIVFGYVEIKHDNEIKSKEEIENLSLYR